MRVAVVIGRFQPFHDGHKALIDFALTQADSVLVMIGDTGFARDSSDPFTIAERRAMIEGAYKSSRVVCDYIFDVPDDDEQWACNLVNYANDIFEDAKEFVLVGHKKDETSFYLNNHLFDEWELLESPPETVKHLGSTPLNATYIRRTLYEGMHPVGVSPLLPDSTLEVLSSKPEGWHIPHANELVQIARFKNEWDCVATRLYGGPILTAADALVFAGPDEDPKVLLIERKGYGDGRIALPGGFVEPNERVFRAALRELKEETGLDLSDRFSAVNVFPTMMFDNPRRSKRCRIITHVLTQTIDEPVPVQGSDDAKKAFWLSLADMDKPEVRARFFADHWHIIDTFRHIPFRKIQKATEV